MPEPELPAVPGPFPKAEMARFLRTYHYAPEAFLVDEVLAIDREAGEVRARMDTTRPLPLSALQRGAPEVHPRHVSGPELLQVTGCLGSLHAYFNYELRWDEGWVGYGTRIHRADFRRLVGLGPPLELRSRELRVRRSRRRLVLRLGFRFEQEGALVYEGDQSAHFLFAGG